MLLREELTAENTFHYFWGDPSSSSSSYFCYLLHVRYIITNCENSLSQARTVLTRECLSISVTELHTCSSLSLCSDSKIPCGKTVLYLEKWLECAVRHICTAVKVNRVNIFAGHKHFFFFVQVTTPWQPLWLWLLLNWSKVEFLHLFLFPSVSCYRGFTHTVVDDTAVRPNDLHTSIDVTAE